MNEISQAEQSSRKECLSIFKTVVVAVLIALLWKVRYFCFLDYWNQAIPLQDDTFFPWFFRNQAVARWAYLMACGLATLTLFCKSQKSLFGLAAGLLATQFVLNIHQSSYNDVTFLCCGWASAWCVWMATRINEPIATLQPRAAWLAHAILSMIFLGGAVGKMTPEFWSGEVLYEIYFREHDYWFYNAIRYYFDAPTVREIATWHSRAVAISELVCGFLWLMPMRIASWLALVMLLGIALTNNVLLFSVVTSLAGLAIVGLHQSPKRSLVRNS
jgi:hypothetical protein